MGCKCSLLYHSVWYIHIKFMYHFSIQLTGSIQETLSAYVIIICTTIFVFIVIHVLYVLAIVCQEIFHQARMRR